MTYAQKILHLLSEQLRVSDLVDRAIRNAHDASSSPLTGVSQTMKDVADYYRGTDKDSDRNVLLGVQRKSPSETVMHRLKDASKGFQDRWSTAKDNRNIDYSGEETPRDVFPDRP